MTGTLVTVRFLFGFIGCEAKKTRPWGGIKGRGGAETGFWLCADRIWGASYARYEVWAVPTVGIKGQASETWVFTGGGGTLRRGDDTTNK
jgi:hypothetical protein